MTRSIFPYFIKVRLHDFGALGLRISKSASQYQLDKCLFLTHICVIFILAYHAQHWKKCCLNTVAVFAAYHIEACTEWGFYAVYTICHHERLVNIPYSKHNEEQQ